jgi:hypothetical protein
MKGNVVANGMTRHIRLVALNQAVEFLLIGYAVALRPCLLVGGLGGRQAAADKRSRQTCCEGA